MNKTRTIISSEHFVSKHKIFCVLILIFLNHNLNAQDTIVFDDASVHPVKVISKNEESITYERRGRTKTALIIDIMQYKVDDLWYGYDKDENKIISSSSVLFELETNPLQRPKKFEYSPYSLNFTFAGDLAPKHDNYFYSPADNWRLRIEPEMHLSKWFSFKIPILIPVQLKGEKMDGAEYTPLANSSFSGTNGIDFAYEYNATISKLPRKKPLVQNIVYSSTAHARDILGQIGITTKFYPFLQKKISLYFSQSANIGIANYNVVDYYSTFSTTTVISAGESILKWALLGENLEVRTAPFIYARCEAAMGFNINLTRHLNFAIEAGITSELMPLGKVEKNSIYVDRGDQLFVKTSEFHTWDPEHRPTGVFNAYVKGRAFLVYRFGGHLKSSNK
ncbi:MAG: hypothetical protein ACI857_002741 [Arenicella sp.]|jgi:hypothetical protein